MDHNKKLVLILLGAITFIFSSCKSEKNTPINFKSGRLDIVNHDFSLNNLDFEGEAFFFPQEFVELDSIDQKKNGILIYTDHSWNNQPETVGKYHSQNFGTYYFSIKLSDKYIGQQFILRPNHFISYASEIYVNKKLVSYNGAIGKSAEDPNYQPARNTNTVPFTVDSTDLTVVIYVSNFSHFRGGIFRPISFGKADKMQQKREHEITFDLLIIISLFAMFIYHFIFYLFYPKDFLALFFSITCLIFSLDLSFQDTMSYALLFPNLPFKYYSFLQLTLPYLYPASFLFFLDSLFPLDVSKKIRNITAIISIVLVLINLPGIISINTLLVKPFYVFAVFIIGYVYFIIIKTTLLKRENAILFFIAFLIFSICAINDILLMFEVINSVNLVSIGFFVFVFLVSVLQSKRSASMNKDNIHLAEKLKRINKRLEKKVEERTFELKKSLESLRKLTVFKEEIANTIVHDLKNSLDVLINSPEINSELKKNNSVNYTARQMLNLVLNILDVQKYETTRLPLKKEKINIQKLWTKVVDFQKYAIKQKNLAIRCTFLKDAHIIADQEFIERVFTNLLSNAIKYSNINSEILFEQKNQNNLLQIAITNIGVAVPKEKIKNLFEKYQQSGMRIKNSTGIGLAFCKLVIDNHGGEIFAESNGIDKTTILFSLPAKEQNIISSQEKVLLDYKITLTEQEKAELSGYVGQLLALDIHQTSFVMEVINKIEAEKVVRKAWIEKIKSTVFSFNEQEFNKMLRLQD